MGLDSVELLVSFENYFGIHISDLEAEKISTVQEMVDCVANHLTVSDDGAQLKAEVFEKLRSTLIVFKLCDNSLTFSDKAFSILDPGNKETWAEVSGELSLQIPVPFMEADTFIQKIFFKGWRPKYDWRSITMDQFVAAICAENYEKLIDPKSVKNTYEVLVAITGITSRNLGLDPYEVQPCKQFVNDLGIN